MKSLDTHKSGAFARALLVCTFCVWLVDANAATVRDDFSSRTWGNNDGSDNWSGPWIEVDGNSTPPSPTNGNVWITNGGELRLEDRPDTGGQPSAAREVNLAGATSAILSFDWRTTNGVDLTDSVVVEVSANGGATWTELQNFTGLSGANSGSASYDIAAFATATTQVRVRVNNLYGGGGETFRLDFIEIDYQIVLSGTELSVTQSDTPDPVNVVSSLAYSLTVSNAGPEDATGVTLVDTLPAGVVFQSASASQGSCTQVGGDVTCILGDLVAAGTAAVNIVVTAPFSTGTINNSAVVSGNETDPVPANNLNVENTTVQNTNINQLCYLVADSGGGNGGNDLLTRIDTADFNPATNETNIGTGTGTNSIEAIALNSATGIVYGANGGRLGRLDTVTGVYQALPQSFGTGNGAQLAITFSDVDGLAYDATTGVLYGAHRRSGGGILIQIDMTTGAHVPDAFGAGVDYVQIQPILGNTIIDDIAIDPISGVLFATTNSGGSTDRLISVNKVTGATTDIALITVPDIEGLGTDPTGQLWGTSGTQGILYEIDKVTGVGSNGRDIDNGGDYEAVDCYAVSPTVSSDLGVTKTVDEAAPLEGDTVSYTVSVSNAGPSPATVVQISDLLPGGVTFLASTPAQGTYDAVGGDWYVGTLAAGASASLVLQAQVDTNAGGTTITNTASVSSLSQVDPNAANDSASVDIVPLGTPNLSIDKTMEVLQDPVNGSTDPKAIPGATINYIVETTNSGSGGADTDTFKVIDRIPTNTLLLVTDYNATTPGPVQFTDGAVASGLSYTFTALDDAADDVEFSDDGGTTWDYEPTANPDGVDPAVTHIRINPKGMLASSSGGNDPSVQLSFKVLVQ